MDSHVEGKTESFEEDIGHKNIEVTEKLRTLHNEELRFCIRLILLW